jgi:hypothetical protein
MQYEIQTHRRYGVKRNNVLTSTTVRQELKGYQVTAEMSSNIRVHDLTCFGYCWWIVTSRPMCDTTPNFERKCSPLGTCRVLLASQVRNTNPISTFQDTVSRTYTGLEQMCVMSHTFKHRLNLTKNKVNSYSGVLLKNKKCQNKHKNNVNCSEII